MAAPPDGIIGDSKLPFTSMFKLSAAWTWQIISKTI
jgi:hypothetical protein